MPVFRGRNIGERGQRGQRFSKPRSKRGCEHPEKLKGKPEECGSQQIRECHGDVVEHPCIRKTS
jgi:hypothetical protein